MLASVFVICGVGSFAYTPNVVVQVADLALAVVGFLGLMVGYSDVLDRKLFALPDDYKFNADSDSYKTLLEKVNG